MTSEISPTIAHFVANWPVWLACVAVAGGAIVALARRRSPLLWPWPGGRAVRLAPIALEILITDRARRRSLEEELRTALARLQQLLGPALPGHTSVVVQDTISQEGHLVGCTHVGKRPGGAHYAIVRLALRVDGQELSADRVLAVLAEQCIALAARRDVGTTVVLPVGPAVSPTARPGPRRNLDGEPASLPDGGAVDVLRPDPLAPSPLAPLAAYRSRDGFTSGGHTG